MRLRTQDMVRLLAILCLCLPLASCTFPPPRRPTGPPPMPPTPTPVPAPLVQATGRGTHYQSPRFVLPPGGWRMRWSYVCRFSGRVRGPDRMLIEVHQVRRRAHPAVVTLADLTIIRGVNRSARGQGMRISSVRGNVYLLLQVSPGCRWQVKALGGL